MISSRFHALRQVARKDFHHPHHLRHLRRGHHRDTEVRFLKPRHVDMRLAGESLPNTREGLERGRMR